MKINYIITKEDVKLISKNIFGFGNIGFKKILILTILYLCFVLFLYLENNFFYEVIYFPLLFVFINYIIPYLSTINHKDKQVFYEIIDDNIVINKADFKSMINFNYFDNYAINGNILTLYKNKYGVQNFLLYKLSQSEQEELISIISSKIPLKN